MELFWRQIYVVVELIRRCLNYSNIQVQTQKKIDLSFPPSRTFCVVDSPSCQQNIEFILNSIVIFDSMHSH